MDLIHRTNYWGKWIDSNNADPDIDFYAIWVQLVNDCDGSCCPGFGRRSVHVVDRDFVAEDSGWWSVFKINEERGYNEDHYFYKFVAIPQGIYGYGKKSCARRGWSYQGEFRACNAREGLAHILGGYLEDDYDVNHVHIGLWMDGVEA